MTDHLTFDFIADPGHGWLVLTPEHRAALTLSSDDFTDFSYVDPQTGTIYAEEDCDAAVVLAAHIRTFGCHPTINEKHTVHDAHCRRLPRLEGVAPKWREAHAYLSRDAYLRVHDEA
mgnify:FL=1